MEGIIKQCVGIDCSKDELAVCFGQLAMPWLESHKATGVFENSPKGFKQILKWSDKLSAKGIAVEFVIEATGVYLMKVSLTFCLIKAERLVLCCRIRHDTLLKHLR